MLPNDERFLVKSPQLVGDRVQRKIFLFGNGRATVYSLPDPVCSRLCGSIFHNNRDFRNSLQISTRDSLVSVVKEAGKSKRWKEKHTYFLIWLSIQVTAVAGTTAAYAYWQTVVEFHEKFASRLFTRPWCPSVMMITISRLPFGASANQLLSSFDDYSG